MSQRNRGSLALRMLTICMWWACLNFIALYLTQQEHWLWFTQLGGLPGQGTVLSVMLGVCFLEAATFTLFVGLARGFAGRSVARRGVLFAAGRYIPLLFVLLISFLYVMLIGASWYLFSQLQIFLGVGHLYALSSNTSELLKWTPSADIASAIFVCVTSAAVVLITALYVPRIGVGVGAAPIMRMVVTSLAGVVLIPYSFIDGSTNVERDRAVSNFTFHMALPSLHLLWAPVLERPLAPRFNPKAVLPCRPVQAAAQANEGTPHDIILINVEALRADILERDDLSEKFPNFWRLKTEGLHFRNAYAASSESNASNISMLTGLFAFRSPWHDTLADPEKRPVPVYSYLDPSLYRSAYFSPDAENWQNVDRVVDHPSLDLFFTARGVTAADIAEAKTTLNLPQLTHGQQTDAVTILKFREWAQGIAPEQRIFARFYFVSSHFPYYLPPPRFRLFGEDEIPDAVMYGMKFAEYDLSYASRMRNRYLGGLALVDHFVGQIRQVLQELGREDASIIFTGDHGQLFGEHGRVTHGTTIFEEAVRVPLIIKPPADRVSRFSLDAPVHHVDIAPTILELAGVADNGQFQGTSLLSARGSPGDSRPRPLFIAVQGLSEEAAVVLWPYKFIYREILNEVALFNVAEDPGETKDLSRSHQSLLRCLGSVLDTFRSTQLSYFHYLEQPRAECAPPVYDHLAGLCKNEGPLWMSVRIGRRARQTVR